MIPIPTWKDIGQAAVLFSVIIITCYASIKVIDAIVAKINITKAFKESV